MCQNPGHNWRVDDLGDHSVTPADTRFSYVSRVEVSLPRNRAMLLICSSFQHCMFVSYQISGLAQDGDESHAVNRSFHNEMPGSRPASCTTPTTITKLTCDQSFASTRYLSLTATSLQTFIWGVSTLPNPSPTVCDRWDDYHMAEVPCHSSAFNLISCTVQCSHAP